MRKRCFIDKDNKSILDNQNIFNKYHQTNKTDNLDIDDNLKIIIPVTINICLTTEKYSIDFIKYSKHLINVLNDGFSGKIKNKYKSTEYSETFFSILANNIEHGKIIYNYINYKFDSKIRFYLDSIVYHNKNFEIEFVDTNTNLLVENFYSQGFKIRNQHKQNLNINIIKFNCSTLGVSTFPWENLISNNNYNNYNNYNNLMFVFIDYKTIHPDLSDIKFNNSRTLIHESGHVFGLKHIFKNNIDSTNCYKILLGNKIFNDIFYNYQYENSFCIQCSINSTNSNIFDENKLYPDITSQLEPTIKNPIEIQIFVTNKYNIPVNFACFMDYSPDEVLTHFTLSQCKIMRAIIYIYKYYLIKYSKDFKKNKKNKTNLFLPPGLTISYNSEKLALNYNIIDSNNYVYKVVFKDNLDYTIKKNPKIIQ